MSGGGGQVMSLEMAPLREVLGEVKYELWAEGKWQAATAEV